MTVRIGERTVGDGHPCYIVAEIGINHQGSVEIAKQLIKVAWDAGANAVKFQKRTVDLVYTPEELARPRDSVFGATNGDLKWGLEFGRDPNQQAEAYEEIDAYCRSLHIPWFASCWDKGAVDFIEQFKPPCYKIPSALLTDLDLLLYPILWTKPALIVSTGMSTLEEIDEAVLPPSDHGELYPVMLLHCCSAYPSAYEDLNLKCIPMLKERYGVPVGYSGHETGIASTVAAVALGACMVERHITLNRAMWGSDQAASLEPTGLNKLVRDIRLVEKSLGDGVKRIAEAEWPIMKKLRKTKSEGA